MISNLKFKRFFGNIQKAFGEIVPYIQILNHRRITYKKISRQHNCSKISPKHSIPYTFPEETVTMMLYTEKQNNKKAIVLSPDDDIDNNAEEVRVLQGDTVVPYLFVVCRENVLRTSINLIKVRR